MKIEFGNPEKEPEPDPGPDLMNNSWYVPLLLAIVVGLLVLCLFAAGGKSL